MCVSSPLFSAYRGSFDVSIFTSLLSVSLAVGSDILLCRLFKLYSMRGESYLKKREEKKLAHTHTGAGARADDMQCCFISYSPHYFSIS